MSDMPKMLVKSGDLVPLEGEESWGGRLEKEVDIRPEVTKRDSVPLLNCATGAQLKPRRLKRHFRILRV